LVGTSVIGRTDMANQNVFRTRLRVVAGLLFSIVCLILLLRDLDWELVRVTLSGVRWYLLLVAVGIEFILFWAIAARWQRYFTPFTTPAIGRLFAILNVAQLANAVLPARLGPLVRVYLAGQGEREGMTRALVTIVGEKALEGITLFLIAVGLLPYLALGHWLHPMTWIPVGLLLVVLGLMIGVALRREAFLGLVAPWLVRWPRLLGSIRTAVSALEVWRNGWAVLALVGWSLLVWVITLVLYQILLWSLDIQVPVIATLTLLVFLQVGVRLPSSPGSIGVFHYLCVVALSFFGVTKSVALSYGLLLHLVTYLPTSLLGLLYLSRKGYSLGRLRQAAEISAADIERQTKDGVPL
jgi:uncharacterized protein (TIRG00374 family)